MTTAKKIDWEEIRELKKYDSTDNNDGYIYGLEYYDDAGNTILDCSWFKTEEEREKSIVADEIQVRN